MSGVPERRFTHAGSGLTRKTLD